MKESRLQLLCYFVPEVSCKVNRKFDRKKAIEESAEGLEIESSLTPEQAPADTLGKYWLVQMTIGKTPKEGENSRYNFKIVLAGYFRFTGGGPSDPDEEQFVRVNGSSMLYGAAREMIRSLTGRAPWGEFFLPTLSFYRKEPAPQEPAAAPANPA